MDINTWKDLITFHQNNKFLLQSKDELLYRKLGKCVGNQENNSLQEVLSQYKILFQDAISKKSSIKTNRNALQHLAGFLKKDLTKEEKITLHQQIEDFTKQLVPLSTPIDTLKNYALKYGISYLLSQTYLEQVSTDHAIDLDIKSEQ